jgi:hypothetical protein
MKQANWKRALEIGFWHFGGALNLNTIVNAMDIIDNINLVFWR